MMKYLFLHILRIVDGGEIKNRVDKKIKPEIKISGFIFF